MGIYDEVGFTCLKCKTVITIQSKAGECILKGYSSDKVPASIAEDIIDEECYCDNCGTSFIVKLNDKPIKTYKMKLENI
jgi:hypothetical protein